MVTPTLSRTIQNSTRFDEKFRRTRARVYAVTCSLRRRKETRRRVTLALCL